ncbi:MAG: steroid delta-isomerase [Burkholderiales bacterium]|nr:MAG: steroid delta-isomerase [Burkholderiales bacterium]TAG81336.1 MAG: steroid delta-isomerase [Betaproteobacteria bacterium]
MDAATVVQAQLDAYNRKDMGALLQTFAPDAEQYELHGALLAKGHAEMSARFAIRFTEPNLHARLISRNVMANFVIDHEEVTRDFKDGIGCVEMICVYEVSDGLIVRASYALSPPRYLR